MVVHPAAGIEAISINKLPRERKQTTRHSEDTPPLLWIAYILFTIVKSRLRQRAVCLGSAVRLQSGYGYGLGGSSTAEMASLLWVTAGMSARWVLRPASRTMRMSPTPIYSCMHLGGPRDLRRWAQTPPVVAMRGWLHFAPRGNSWFGFESVRSRT